MGGGGGVGRWVTVGMGVGGWVGVGGWGLASVR